MRQIILAASVAALLTAIPTGRAVQVSAMADSQQTSSPAVQHDHSQTAAGKSSMQDMMKMHQQMMADMKAADTKLDRLVQQMNAASSAEKLNATTAVVTELVRQQKAMHEHMAKMHEHMMSGMMMKQ